MNEVSSVYVTYLALFYTGNYAIYEQTIFYVEMMQFWKMECNVAEWAHANICVVSMGSIRLVEFQRDPKREKCHSV